MVRSRAHRRGRRRWHGSYGRRGGLVGVAERANEPGEKAIAGRATEAPPRPGSPPRPATGPPTGPAGRPATVEGGGRPAGRPPAARTRTKPNWGRVVRRTWWLILLALVVNWIIASTLMGTSRTTVSYTFFREQVQAGNVSEVTSTGDTIEGAFRTAAKYPPNDGDAKDVTDFTTQRPAFGDDGLTAAAAGRRTSRSTPSRRTRCRCGSRCWSASARRCCSSACWCGSSGGWRRPAAGSAALGGIGRSRAKRYEPEPGRGPRSPTSPASTR